MEIDPLYVDVTIRRFEKLTGIEAVLAESGQTFSAVSAQRGCSGPRPRRGTHAMER